MGLGGGVAGTPIEGGWGVSWGEGLFGTPLEGFEGVQRWGALGGVLGIQDPFRGGRGGVGGDAWGRGMCIWDSLEKGGGRSQGIWGAWDPLRGALGGPWGGLGMIWGVVLGIWDSLRVGWEGSSGGGIWTPKGIWGCPGGV